MSDVLLTLLKGCQKLQLSLSESGRNMVLQVEQTSILYFSFMEKANEKESQKS